MKGRLIGELVPFRHPDNRWRHFEALDRFPSRLVATGEAVASFNPVYGQGMSSAMLHASCLSEYLRGQPDLDAPARHFFALHHVVVAAWQTSATADAARLGLAGRPATAEQHGTLRGETVGRRGVPRNIRHGLRNLDQKLLIYLP